MPPVPELKVGRVQCDFCDHIWRAQRPVGQQELECPNCHRVGEVDEVEERNE